MQMDLLVIEFRNVCGIYRFIHRASGRSYVGQSTNCGKRITEHKCRAKSGRAGTFYDTIRSDGIGAFDFELLEKCEQCQLTEREEYWIDFYNAASVSGFNVLKNPGDSPFGMEISDASKMRMSLAKKGRKMHPNTLAALAKAREARKGIPMSEETRLKISAANTGKIRSPEAREKVRQFRLQYKIPESTRQKMREIGIKRGGLCPLAIENSRKFWLGKHHTEETKAKLRAFATGRHLSDAGKEKLRQFWTGRKHTPETIARMKIAAQNRGPSELRNQKLKEAWIQRRKKALDVADDIFFCNNNEARTENRI